VNTLALFFIYAKTNPNFDDSWKSYINVLPERVDNLLTVSEKELNLLKGSPLYDLAKTRREHQNETYHKHILPLSLKEVEIFPKSISQTDWVWAISVVLSRKFNLQNANGQFVAVVPFADMFNHRPLTHQHSFAFGYSEEGEFFHVEAVDNVEIGAEVLLPYGGKCNFDWLLDYGFVMQALSENCFYVDLDHLKVPTSDPNKEAKEKLLDSFDLPRQTNRKLYSTSLSENLLMAVRTIVANRAEIKSSNKIIKGKKLSQETELAVTRWFQEYTTQKLSEYPTTFQDDSTMYRSELFQFLPATTKVIFTYRKLEKEVLWNVRDLFEEQEEQLILGQ